MHPSSVLLLFILRISALGRSRNESRKLGRSSSLLDRQEEIIECLLDTAGLEGAGSTVEIPERRRQVKRKWGRFESTS